MTSVLWNGIAVERCVCWPFRGSASSHVSVGIRIICVSQEWSRQEISFKETFLDWGASLMQSLLEGDISNQAEEDSRISNHT